MSGKDQAPDGARLAAAIAEALEGLKAQEVRILDVRGLTDVMDFVVLATCLSERQMKALRAAAEEAVDAGGRSALGSEGTEASGWVVVDTGDVVTHLMTRVARAYYDLDGLWADACPPPHRQANAVFPPAVSGGAGTRKGPSRAPQSGSEA